MCVLEWDRVMATYMSFLALCVAVSSRPAPGGGGSPGQPDHPAEDQF